MGELAMVVSPLAARGRRGLVFLFFIGDRNAIEPEFGPRQVFLTQFSNHPLEELLRTLPFDGSAGEKCSFDCFFAINRDADSCHDRLHTSTPSTGNKIPESPLRHYSHSVFGVQPDKMDNFPKSPLESCRHGD